MFDFEKKLYLCPMNSTEYLDIEIDKLTNSIENRTNGNVFDTEVLQLSVKDKRQIIKKDWRFNWHSELSNENRKIYKLVICSDISIIQGLLSLELKTDHIYLHLIESASFNCGKDKLYLGVPGNLVAFACKTSFVCGFDGSNDVRDSILRNEIKATGLQQIARIAELAVEQADRYIKTGSTGQPEKQLIDCTLITANNARNLDNFVLK